MLWHCGNKSILTSLTSLKQNPQEPITTQQHKKTCQLLRSKWTLDFSRSSVSTAFLTCLIFTRSVYGFDKPFVTGNYSEIEQWIQDVWGRKLVVSSEISGQPVCVYLVSLQRCIVMSTTNVSQWKKCERVLISRIHAGCQSTLLLHAAL